MRIIKNILFVILSLYGVSASAQSGCKMNYIDTGTGIMHSAVFDSIFQVTPTDTSIIFEVGTSLCRTTVEAAFPDPDLQDTSFFEDGIFTVINTDGDRQDYDVCDMISECLLDTNYVMNDTLFMTDTKGNTVAHYIPFDWSSETEVQGDTTLIIYNWMYGSQVGSDTTMLPRPPPDNIDVTTFIMGDTTYAEFCVLPDGNCEVIPIKCPPAVDINQWSVGDTIFTESCVDNVCDTAFFVSAMADIDVCAIVDSCELGDSAWVENDSLFIQDTDGNIVSYFAASDTASIETNQFISGDSTFTEICITSQQTTQCDTFCNKLPDLGGFFYNADSTEIGHATSTGDTVFLPVLGGNDFGNFYSSGDTSFHVTSSNDTMWVLSTLDTITSEDSTFLVSLTEDYLGNSNSDTFCIKAPSEGGATVTSEYIVSDSIAYPDTVRYTEIHTHSDGSMDTLIFDVCKETCHSIALANCDNDIDCDGGGVSDCEEIANGTDPSDPTDDDTAVAINDSISISACCNTYFSIVGPNDIFEVSTDVDTFCEFGNTTFQVIDQPTTGFINFNSDGSVCFAPYDSIFPDSFHYSILCDGIPKDTATVYLVPISLPRSQLAITTTPVDDGSELTTGNFTICIEADLDDDTELDNGDLVGLVLTDNFGVVIADVDLIVGSDITTGFQNDVGNNWANNFAPFIAPTVLDAAVLNNNSGGVCFNFEKRTWAVDNNRTYQDGNFSGTPGDIGQVFTSAATDIIICTDATDVSSNNTVLGNCDTIERLVDDIVVMADTDVTTTNDIEMFAGLDYATPFSNMVNFLGTSYTLTNSIPPNVISEGQTLNATRVTNYYRSTVAYDPSASNGVTIWDNGMRTENERSIGERSSEADVGWWIFDRESRPDLGTINGYASPPPVLESAYSGTLDVPLDVYHSTTLSTQNEGFDSLPNTQYSFNYGAPVPIVPTQWGAFGGGTSRKNYLDTVNVPLAIGQRGQILYEGEARRNDGSAILDPWHYITQFEINYAY